MCHVYIWGRGVRQGGEWLEKLFLAYKMTLHRYVCVCTCIFIVYIIAL